MIAAAAQRPESATRPMRKDARRNQLQVLDAAREVLSEFGEDATMELVASHAGVGVGTIYRHYPNKAALFTALVQVIQGELIAAAGDALSDTNGTGLNAFLLVLGESFAEHRGYADKLMNHADDESTFLLRGLIGDLLQQAQAAGSVSPRVTQDDVMATTWGIRGVIDTLATDPDTARPVWQRFLNIALAGLRSV